MGLDNGIIVKTNNEKLNKKLKGFKTAYPWIEESTEDKKIEVAYWRKCWNIRNLILNELKKTKGEIPQNDSQTSLLTEDIDNIIKILKSLNKKNWEDYGSSIWTYKEQKPYNRIYIKNLKRLKRLMKLFPNEFEVSFYDSY